MHQHGIIEPIPESQAEINKQADAAIRDLFPRIPNTDRESIIQHAFQKVRFAEVGKCSTNCYAGRYITRRADSWPTEVNTIVKTSAARCAGAYSTHTYQI